MPGPRRHALVAYVVTGLTLVSLELPINALVPEFYTDVVGVDVGSVAAVLFAARVFDAVNDPAIGALTDATRTRIGRRRPWLLAGAMPLGISMFALLAPPSLASAHPAAYLLVALLATDLFWTSVTVPYEALGIEMTTTYDERTRVLGLRDGVALAGAAVLSVVPPALAWALRLPATPAGDRAKLATYAAIFAPLVVVACAWTAITSRERPAPTAEERSAAGLGARLAAVARNRPFWIVLGSYTLGGIATQLPVTLHAFFVRYVLLADRADTYLPGFVVTGVVALPFWLWLARRTEKRTAYVAALLLSAAAQASAFAVRPGQTSLFWVMTIASGLPFGGLLALPNTMQGDVVDLGARQAGGRRDEGLYLGVWSVARKLAGAGGAAVGLLVLSRLGFVANAAQPPAVTTALRLLYSVVPAGVSVAAAVASLRYPIDRARHARIVAELERGA
ncbi:MAG: MFS transporter [Myxococcales bacterium]|nr:MFS transporter [Myxococcales bacterium]